MKLLLVRGFPLSPEKNRPLRIAIADDDPLFRDFLDRILTGLGHDVVVKAYDGESLFTQCAQQAIDLIITDICMPHMDGIEAVRQLQSRQSVPVIFLTGYTSEELLHQATTEFALSYLIKPLKQADLGPAIETVMRRFADAERLRQEKAFLTLARSESLRVVAAGIASQCVGHFRAMLDSVRVLDEILTNPKAKFLVRMTTRSIEDALRIASALHDYTGSNIRVSQRINLSDLVYRSQPLIHGVIPEGSVVHYSLPKELPDIVGDPVKIEQCLFTLVRNAVESYGNGNGPVWVATSYRKLTPKECRMGKIGSPNPDDSYVLLETRDQGCGMDERLLVRIFDPFFSTKFLGRGLGLSAVAGIVRSHGGVILVTTAPGRGTCIRLCFPAVDLRN